jgi:hypothetical protein
MGLHQTKILSSSSFFSFNFTTETLKRFKTENSVCNSFHTITFKEFPLQNSLFEFLRRKIPFITLKEEFDGLKYLFTELIRVKAFSYDQYLKDLYSFDILYDHKRFIENLFEKDSKISSINLRRNMLYGTTQILNVSGNSTEQLYHQKDRENIVNLKEAINNYLIDKMDFSKLKELLDICNLYQIHTSIEKLLPELDFESMEENEWERLFSILSYIGDYSTLIEILISNIEKSSTFNSFFISHLVNLKEILLSFNLMNNVAHLIIKKCPKSSKDHHRIIEDFIRRLTCDYPNIIDFEMLQKEFNSLSFFLQGINAPVPKRMPIVPTERDLTENIKKLVENIDSWKEMRISVEKLKEFKHTKKNSDAISLFRFGIGKFISLFESDPQTAFLYISLLRELYSFGIVTMPDIADAISNYIQSNFTTEFDTNRFTHFLIGCVSKGIISSENLIENILENTFKNLNRILQSGIDEASTKTISLSEMHLKFIESLLMNKNQKLNYSGKMIPKIVKKIVEFVEQKTDAFPNTSEKIIKVLEDVFLERTIFEKVSCQPELLNNCLKELNKLPKEKIKKNIDTFFSSLYKRSLIEVPDFVSMSSFINYLIKHSSIWNHWLSSMTFSEFFLSKVSNDYILKLTTPMIDLRNKNEKNLISFSQMICSQNITEVNEKLLSELNRIIHSKTSSIQIQNICHSLIHSTDKICVIIARELNSIYEYSKNYSILKDAPEFEENQKKLQVLLNFFRKISVHLTTIPSEFFRCLLNLSFSKYSNYESIQSLLHSVFTQIYNKLDEKKKEELNRTIYLSKGIKKGWDNIEEYTSICMNCNTVHSRITPNPKEYPSTATKRKALYFEVQNKKQKLK